MNQEELLFLVSVTVVMPIMALWIILNYQKARLIVKKELKDQWLTTSELNEIIDESVALATEPLNDRVAELERHVQSLGPGLHDRLDGFDETGPDAAAPVKTLGKTRS